MTTTAKVKPFLTPIQQDVLRGLIALTKAKGYPPSLAELAAQVGLNSPSSVSYNLRQLAELGYIERVPNVPRAIRVLMTPPPRGRAQRSTTTSR